MGNVWTTKLLGITNRRVSNVNCDKERHNPELGILLPDLESAGDSSLETRKNFQDLPDIGYLDVIDYFIPKHIQIMSIELYWR